MKYTVVWVRQAEERLADLWLNAGNRADITRAANKIDDDLARDPLQTGEQREGLFRIVIESPLAAYFFVSPSDRVVRVLAVHQFR